jgi:formylmethanofuran dehydrogenase subunit E
MAESKADKPEETTQPEVQAPAQKVRVARGVTTDGDENAEVVTANNKPNLQESGAAVKTVDEEPAPEAPVKEAEACWNCGETLADDKCEACGFDKGTLYNHQLEAQRERERQAE